jgi:hypothetical protein
VPNKDKNYIITKGTKMARVNKQYREDAKERIIAAAI